MQEHRSAIAIIAMLSMVASGVVLGWALSEPIPQGLEFDGTQCLKVKAGCHFIFVTDGEGRWAWSEDELGVWTKHRVVQDGSCFKIEPKAEVAVHAARMPLLRREHAGRGRTTCGLLKSTAPIKTLGPQ